MGEIVYAGLMPHPPIMIPEVGRENVKQVRATVTAARKLAADIGTHCPDVLIIITSHGAVFSDAIAINHSPLLTGNLEQFDAPQVEITRSNDVQLVEAITRLSLGKGIAVARVDDDLSREYGVSTALDHGTMVPLYYLDEALKDIPLVHITMGFLSREELYLFGTLLQDAIMQSSHRAAIIASGDLSHRLTPHASAGYHPQGRVFDGEIYRLLQNQDVEGVLDLPYDLVEQAGECGLRPIIMMLGALDGFDLSSQVLSYEGPFGVGYMVAALQPVGKNAQRKLVAKIFTKRDNRIKDIRAGESFAVKLAREAIETYLSTGKIPKASAHGPEEWPPQAGTFVSLKKHGQLRGCIGTTGPTQPSTAQEIINNAIAAAQEDPRFDPVTMEELDELVYSVDILGEPEGIPDQSYLNPKEYGVIVRQGRRSGLLLPDLEGVDTVEQQVEIAKRKAGISGTDYTLERFTVTRYL